MNFYCKECNSEEEIVNRVYHCINCGCNYCGSCWFGILENNGSNYYKLEESKQPFDEIIAVFCSKYCIDE